VAALASSTSTGRSTVEELQREVVPLLVETAGRITVDLGGTARAVP
jgi:IclR family transcriptional regulator, pca regulon regulatory protein